MSILNINAKKILERGDGTTTWGYGRIPAVATDGSAIYIATSCRTTGADLTGGVLNSIGFMKSTDAGGTFTALSVVLSDTVIGFDDPAISYNSDTGRLTIVATSTNGLSGGEYPQLSASYVAIIHSDDYGTTWSNPSYVTSSYDSTVTSSGNGIYIADLDRTVFPCYGLPVGGSAYCPFMMYSDDNGTTWSFSTMANFNDYNDGENRVLYDNGKYWCISRVDSYQNRGVYYSEDLITWIESPERSRQLNNLGVNFGAVILDGITYYCSCDVGGAVGDKIGAITYRYGGIYKTSNDIFATETQSLNVVSSYKSNSYYFGYSCIAVNANFAYIIYESEGLDSLSMIRIRIG